MTPKESLRLLNYSKIPQRLFVKTAGTALVTIGSASVDALLETLKDPHFVVRCHGVRALGGMTTDYQIGRAWVKEPRVVEALIKLLKDPDRAVREDATYRVGKYWRSGRRRWPFRNDEGWGGKTTCDPHH